jgi:hypothetical protein
MELNGQLYAPAALTLGTKLCTNRVEGWVGSRDILDGFGEEKMFCPFWDLNPQTSSP